MKSIEKNIVRKRACVEYLRVNFVVMKVIRGLQPFPIKLSMKKLHLKLTYFNKNMHAQKKLEKRFCCLAKRLGIKGTYQFVLN